MGWQSGRTLTPVPIRTRVVRAAIAAASTSGTAAIDGMPAPMGSVGRLCMAKCRSASQTPSSPCVSAISAMDTFHHQADMHVRLLYTVWDVSTVARLYCARSRWRGARTGDGTGLNRRHQDFQCARQLVYA